MFEAILLICVLTPLNNWVGTEDTGSNCVYMNTGRTEQFPTLGQCNFWLKQAKMEAQQKEHYDVIQQRLPSALEGRYKIKGKCTHIVFDDNYICQDCGT